MKMRGIYVLLSLLVFSLSAKSQSNQVAISRSQDGMKLVVDGKDFMINGMNWDYFPRGTNYAYSLWGQTDEVIKEALEGEMTLLNAMGVNAVRQYTGIPARWIQYIYEEYGIFTMLNHSFGRYGIELDGTWIPNTEYSDPRVREQLLTEVRALATDYRDTPGLLLYLLGNENNFGLFWEGAETEEIPDEIDHFSDRARAMYKLFNEAALLMKDLDTSHPVAMCNGDLQFIEIISEECGDVDIFGTNMYRGASFGDAFKRVKDELNKPIMFTEFGADAYNSVEGKEDQKPQAYYMVENWKEIYANAAGYGKTGNSIGGFTFQFSDGWWKFGQENNLDIHDNNASWPNGGYTHDFEKGKNNMNEEWFGICAKGKTNDRGLYKLYPRAAYYALKEVHHLDPYSSGMNLQKLENHFDTIQLDAAVERAQKEKAAFERE